MATPTVPTPAQNSPPTANHPGLGILGQLRAWLPGVLFAAMLAWLAEATARWIGTNLLGYAKSPVGGVPLAILLGVVCCNAIELPEFFKTGLRWCATTLLRTAIVLLGLRLSLGAAAGIGWHALPIVVLCIGTALTLVPWLGRRAGLPHRLASLIAVGTGICGVTAIVATAPAIGAEEDEVSYAVGCVAIFGMTAMLAYPWLAHLIFAENARAAGIFIGTAIHDTSQVAGAALTLANHYHAPDALNVATVTKLMRNLFLAVVVPFVIWRHARTAPTPAGRRTSWRAALPLFVLGFVGMSLVRTIGDSAVSRPFGLLETAQWRHLLASADNFSAGAITVVMASIGLQTNFSRFRRLGVRPLLVGFGAAGAVGAVSSGCLLIATRLAGW